MKTKYFLHTFIFIIMSSNAFSCLAYENTVDTSGKISGQPNSTYSKLSIEDLSRIHFKYAIVLDTTAESIMNKKLYDLLDGWMGVQYRYGGQSKEGIDCSSFSGMLFKYIYGLDLPRTSQEQYDNCIPVETTELSEGDLLFFKTGKRTISHVGFYLGNGRFAHASTQKGVTIDHLEFPYYKKRFVGGGRIIRKDPDH